jgi:hypothetical protein
MLTAAVTPVVTLPIDSVFAGPVAPVRPVVPRGSPKSSLAAYDVPALTTVAEAVGASVVTAPT